MNFLRIAAVKSLLAAALLLAACNSKPSENQSASADSTKTNNAASKEVNVYSQRHYEVDQKLYAEFEKETGIKVNVINNSADQLIQMLQSEKENSRADLLITSDAGRLFRAKEKGLLQPVSSEVLNQNIPAHLRDKDGYCYAITQRTRVIVYSKKRVKPEQLSTYQDLANPKWKKKLVMRPSENAYNQSLLAALIAHEGEANAKNWAAGVVSNMAREPKGKDKDQIKDIAAGLGDVSIVNTYYLAKMLEGEEEGDKEAAEQVAVFFPNQSTFGTHVNISGAALTKYAPNKENAVKLLEFLLSEKAQKILTDENQEYPVRPGVPASAILQSMGTFKGDTLDLSLLGKYNSDAVKIFDQVKWK